MREHSFVHGASYADVRQLIINITKRLLSNPPALFAAHHRSQGRSNAVRTARKGEAADAFLSEPVVKPSLTEMGFLEWRSLWLQ